MKSFITSLMLILTPVQIVDQPVPRTSSITYLEPIPEIAKFDSPEILVPKRKDLPWPSELKRICSCESTGRPGNDPVHFDQNGEVLKGKINPLDTGMCQINLHYHEAAATARGLDLFDPEHNFEYALHLYQQQGSQPWVWSQHCWSPTPA